MKYFFLLFIVIAAATTNAQSNKGPYKIKRGTNIAHWLSQSKKRGAEREAFFTKKDVQFIASAGFDHFRLPVDEEQLWDSSGKRYDDAFILLDNALKWANETGLRVVLDLHILRSHYFNASEKPLWSKPEEQDKFIRLWKDLSNAVKKYPNSVVATIFKFPVEYTGRTVGVVGEDRTCAEYAGMMSKVLRRNVYYHHIPRDIFIGFDSSHAEQWADVFEVQRLHQVNHMIDIIESYGLNPAMQRFETWLERNKERILVQIPSEEEGVLA